MNANIPNLNDYCAQLQKTLNLHHKLQEFNNLPDNASRIKFLHPLITFAQFPRTIKSIQRASTLKIEGDQLLHGGNYDAVSVYNEAIKECPQDDSEGRELYATLLEKRSGVFCLNKEYRKALEDVSFIYEYASHPKQEALGAREKKIKEALKRSNAPQPEQRPEDAWASKNKKYPVLSEKLTVDSEEKVGRFFVATKDIKTDEILAVEAPYASVVWHRTMCSHCASWTNRLYACPRCHEMYCSRKCMGSAQTYHRYECDNVLPLDTDWLPFRMITQRPLEQVLKDHEVANRERGVDQSEVYKTDDYYNINRLFSPEETRRKNLVYGNTFKVIIWLRLLRMVGYFPPKEGDGDLSKEEVSVGELMLKYMQIKKYNSYTIYGPDIVVGGTGVYCTMALINHSCDPSVVGYNMKNKLVLRSRRPIKAGDFVTMNYTPTYVTMSKQDRDGIIANYDFACACLPCAQNWPLFEGMDANVLRILCDCGAGLLWDRNAPVLKCGKCSKETDMKNRKKLIQDVKVKIKKADTLFARGQFNSAQKLYAELLDVVFGFCAPPCYLISVLQRQFKSCIQNINAHQGVQ